MCDTVPRSDDNERDINDVFDDILLTEETLTKQSYGDGFREGAAAGNPEGYHLGYHRGAEIGAEFGYYFGIAKVFAKTETSDKITKALALLLQQIESFPKTNDETIDIFAVADQIRAQFKKVCALLKINGKYPEADLLNF